MNRELSLADLRHVMCTQIRAARMYNRLVWKCRQRGESVVSWVQCRNRAMKKMRHWQNIIKQMMA